MRTYAARLPSHATPDTAERAPRALPAVRAILRSPRIQPKLTIGAVNDPAEREADRVADQVMRMGERDIAAGAVAVPTEPARIRRLCPECEDEMHLRPKAIPSQPAPHLRHRWSNSDDDLRRYPARKEHELQANQVPGHAGDVPSDVQADIDALQHGGQLLPASVRTFFEPRFGHDFSHVRIHTGAQAAHAAAAVNAQAYTLGQHIVFGDGHYAPETETSRRLLAHELTHTVQQRNGTSGRIETMPRGPTRASPLSVQRLGNPSQAPTGMICPIATSSPAFVVTNAFFSIESGTLTPTAIADIAAFIASWTAAGANKPVRVDGFASVDGPDPLNWTLSCDRALAVEAELMTPSAGGPGVPASLIEIFAQGETDEFSTALAPNRRATISADLAIAPPPSCANPGVSRDLDLQPIFLRTDAADASPTGGSWTRRFNEANFIWGKIGVTFNALTPVTLDTALKTTGTTEAEANALAGLRTAAGVEVFLVDNDMATAGGASTAAGCGAAGNIVMSDRGTSDTLLAHELGHIVGIGHPGAGANAGDPGTIMDPSNSHSTANPTRNTMVNFARIACPAATGSTCLNPDP